MNLFDARGCRDPGTTVCRGGVRECDILKWQAFVYLHWLTLPELGLPLVNHT